MDEAAFEPICLTEAASIQETHSRMSSVAKGVGETAAFAALYHESDVLWVGSIFGADFVQRKLGADPTVMFASVASGVGYVEYKFSGLARRIFDGKIDEQQEKPSLRERAMGLGSFVTNLVHNKRNKATEDEPKIKVPFLERVKSLNEKVSGHIEKIKEKLPTYSSKTIRELGGLAYGAFAGSANGVKVNGALGLESTPNRRRMQSAAFGIAVALWTTDTPGFEQGAGAVKDYVGDALDSPESFAKYSAVTIAVILTAAKIVKESRRVVSRQWTRHKERKVAAAKAPNNRRIY